MPVIYIYTLSQDAESKRDGRNIFHRIFKNKLHHVYNIKILLLFVKIILKVERAEEIIRT